MGASAPLGRQLAVSHGVPFGTPLPHNSFTLVMVCIFKVYDCFLENRHCCNANLKQNKNLKYKPTKIKNCLCYNPSP
jgi:hypothetical protein